MRTHIQGNRNGWHIAGALAVYVVVSVAGLVVAFGKWAAHWIGEFFGEREIV